MSRSMTASQTNYPIQEQELRAFIYSLKKWTLLLRSGDYSLHVSLLRDLGHHVVLYQPQDQAVVSTFATALSTDCVSRGTPH